MNLVKRVENLEARPLLRIVPVEPVPFQRPDDVLAAIEEQANAVRADPFADPGERARTLGFLASVALRAIEAKDQGARVEAITRVLKLRKDAQEDERKLVIEAMARNDDAEVERLQRSCPRASYTSQDPQF